ncbi:MAG: thiamine biosynthesis protein ThiF [Paenibacillus sp.]|nr:thiamine biosynthesis protein ThiF [Paenibacillus sp.]
MPARDPDWRERYSRQIRYAPIGEAGQLRLMDSTVLIAGCGALGCALAQHMLRSGVGKLVLVDRDYVERSNLHRQTLFDEEDADKALPKAEAAAAKLRRMNRDARVEAHVSDITKDNAAVFAAGVDLVLDGTDNAATRLLLCDEAFRGGIPFVYGGATASRGMTAMLVPGGTACLRCLIGAEGEEGDNCDTAGILPAVIEWVAALQAAEAVKWLSGNRGAVRNSWLSADIWQFALRESKLPAGYGGCRICGGSGDSTEAAVDMEVGPASNNVMGDVNKIGDCGVAMPLRRSVAASSALCGRDTVQVTLGHPIDLAAEAEKLRGLGCRLTENRYLAKAELPVPLVEKLVLFPDGRVLVQGTSDIARAEQLCVAFVGGASEGLEESLK